MIFSFVNYVFITDIISLEYVLQSVRDSNARPDEPVRTGKSFFYRAARKKRLQCPPVPVRTGIARPLAPRLGFALINLHFGQYKKSLIKVK